MLLSIFLSNGMAAEVNVYSARKQALIEPLLDQFTQQTGIAVNLVTGEADTLIKRLEAEGRHSPADVLIATDVARLYRAGRLELFQQIDSELLRSSVPAQYRDVNNRWFGLSLRSRIIVYSPKRVGTDELRDYLSLSDAKWHGRICVRSSSNSYNQSLVAALIARHGMQKTEQWADNFVKNFARPPTGGDRDQIRAVASGECDIALVNNYYLAGMLDSSRKQEVEVAQAVDLFWPNQDTNGAHVNISGAGVARYARNKENAVKLLEFLVGDVAQHWFAAANHEYPVKPGIQASSILSQWGEFKPDNIELNRLGMLNKPAVLLMDRAGWW